jgi:hypothetical protein
MTSLFGIGFAAPWILGALVVLPLLWLLLRAMPPAPVLRRFPGVLLLLGLEDQQTVTARTPPWLLMLRSLIAVMLILGLAGPVLNPAPDRGTQNPLLVVVDGGWAGAAVWETRKTIVADQLGQTGRPVALLVLTAPAPVTFGPANKISDVIPAPAPWLPDAAQAVELLPDGQSFDTLWFSDGIEFRGRAALAAALAQRGTLRIVPNGIAPIALLPPHMEDGAIVMAALRRDPQTEQTIQVGVHGRDPAGNDAILASVDLRFDSGETQAAQTLSLRPELRARVTRFAVMGQSSAGAVQLADDQLHRQKIALIAAQADDEGPQLLSPLYYLRRALAPNATLLDLALSEAIPANPDAIILADVAQMPPAEAADLEGWVSRGGILLRFAGPRLASSDLNSQDRDPLMPVQLRAGGRSLGGAMSWGAPKELAPFAPGSPFWGLPIPPDIRVRSQVIAQPGPDLSQHVIAALSDGTPLVTRAALGAGQVVLFHVGATGAWSDLPLSGLFVQMLERLAVATPAQRPTASALEGTQWVPVSVMDGFGRMTDPDAQAGVAGPALIDGPLGPDLRPGLYEQGTRALARNAVGADLQMTPPEWPPGTVIQGDIRQERRLSGPLLAAGLMLMVVDVVATLAVGGRLVAMATFVLAIMGLPQGGWAQQNADDFAKIATADLVLAHVITGDRALDELANAGLYGLSETLFFRTSVEPAMPIGVDLEQDELAFFPMLYWPIHPDQPRPSAEAYRKLNAYLRSGGMILFDTRDADIGGYGGTSRNGRKLQELAAPLDIPPLEPIPSDHILTRTFYLLRDFPGRHQSRDLWVEAAPANSARPDGQPFRNLNDGVTPVVIGGNDWASAWAMRRDGSLLAPIGQGVSGNHQRELAFRFGVNLVMYVLTGNYKSDQVHVPALLERLGQ